MSRRPVLEAVLRAFAALPLAYLAAASLAAATGVLLAFAGVPKTEAVGWPMLGSYLIWLALGLYAFGARSVLRAWAVPGLLALVAVAVVWRIDVGGMI
ncbi:hypothetical protein PC39_07149 [Salinisphaera sp. PC39]|uniref:hypothetical protein n=1 Tax=Salinisphaera sp. PC39 TaxID=1304156 RepID=UPI00333E5C90